MKNKKEANQVSSKELLSLAEALQELDSKYQYNKLQNFYYPDTGTYKRDFYPKHLKFMEAGLKHTRRAFIAANRCGKSVAGAYETVLHLTGKYPDWWKGKRFNRPIKAWGCAIENKQLREGMQELMFGDFSDKGTGMIPKNDLMDDTGEIQTWAMAGTANCVGTARVRHYTRGVFDGWSDINFKTYEQGWQQFQGAKRDWIWLDEEPNDPKVYSECVTRTAGIEGQEGHIICTFTPLLGMSTVVLGFMPNGHMPKDGIHPGNAEKFVITATWDDCPHLSEKWKTAQIQEYSQYEPQNMEARSKGIPALGSGRIYPIDEESVVVHPFNIPNYWARAYGLDFGWNNTAVVWIAKDPISNIRYIYAEYKQGKVNDILHAESIKLRGRWINGACDPSGGGRRDDGSMRMDYFRTLGLELYTGENAVIAGISRLLAAFQSGSLKIFSNCTQILDEIRVYRYDMNDPNKPAKDQNDHLLDALKYVDSRFDEIAQSYEDKEELEYQEKHDKPDSSQDRNGITGY